MSFKEFSSRQVKFFFAGFFAVNLFLSTYFIDAWLTPNAASRAIPVLTLYESKSLVIDKYQNFTGDKAFINDHYYTDKAPLSTFLVYPFYSLYKAISTTPDSVDRINKYPIYIWEAVGTKDGRAFLFPKVNVPLVLGSFLCGSLPFALLVTILFYFTYRHQGSISSVALVMLAAYGTFLFGLSGVYFGHLLSGLFLLATYIFIKHDKNYFWAGLFVGLAFLTEYTTAIAGPIWLFLIFYNRRDFKKTILFCAGTVPALLFILYYNQITTGNKFDLLYNHAALAAFSEMKSQLGFRMPKLEALWGLLFSSYRGLFFYAPVLLLMTYYFVTQVFEYKWKCLTNNYLLLFALIYLLVNASYYMWWGGWSFGPRHLVPVAMLLLFEGIILLSEIKFSNIIFYILSFSGILLAWGGKATRIYMMPDDASRFSNPLTSLILPDFSQHKFNANSLPTIWFDFSPQTSVYLWPVLFALSVILMDKWYQNLILEKAIEIKPLIIKSSVKKTFNPNRSNEAGQKRKK